MKRRAIKMPTPERLRNIALYYLSRYAASEASLRRVLTNRLRRAQMALPEFAADTLRQAALRDEIERIIEAHTKTGAVNDTAIADMKVASLRRSGKSGRFIQQKLAAHGLQKENVARALQDHDGAEAGEEAEMKAALAFCKRRRIGAFRPIGKGKEGDSKKDFGALARAGYSSAIIRSVLKTPRDDDVEDWD